MVDLYQHRARKRFGQNFLQDMNIIDRIMQAIHPLRTDHLLEIGPGRGALTQELLKEARQLDVIELDQDLIPLLNLRFGLNSAFHLHQGDALKFNFAEIALGNPLRVVGNLPYNISTPLIFHLLDYADIIKDMHFMLQKEVVERMAAEPGTGNWGRLTIMVQYFCQVEHLFNVPPACFTPSPKVDSAIVRLTPYRILPFPAKDHKLLELVVREAFNQRRKTLRNTLKQILPIEAIEQTGINASLRPEQLMLADFVKLADKLYEYKQSYKES